MYFEKRGCLRVSIDQYRIWSVNVTWLEQNVPMSCAAQKACDQGNHHTAEAKTLVRPVKRKRRSYVAGLTSFAVCFGRRPACEAGRNHRLSHHQHTGPKHCCKLAAAFCLKGGVHVRATVSMTLSDKAISLDVERIDSSDAYDCEVLELKATLLSSKGMY